MGQDAFATNYSFFLHHQSVAAPSDFPQHFISQSHESPSPFPVHARVGKGKEGNDFFFLCRPMDRCNFCAVQKKNSFASLFVLVASPQHCECLFSPPRNFARSRCVSLVFVMLIVFLPFTFQRASISGRIPWRPRSTSTSWFPRRTLETSQITWTSGGSSTR